MVIGPRPTDDLWDVDLLTLAWVVGRLDARMDRRTMLLLAAGMTAETAASIADPWERLSRALRGPQMLDDDRLNGSKRAPSASTGSNTSCPPEPSTKG
ncbi:hypothetical protein [Microbispora sitophila]|uniref:hypothetical protein n=1 Tax=Microbispora sitophila TaxID=2771537 RepID=UPI001D0218CA|nr:hypothetical protein [Microbispora sitophila]